MVAIVAWLGRGLVGSLACHLIIRSWRKLRPGPRPIWLDWQPLAAVRRLIRPTSTLITQLGLQPGMRVVEVGAGTSRMARELADAVGVDGQVLALDERREAIDRIQIETLESGQPQVITALAAAAALPESAASSDLILFASTFGGLADKQTAAEEAYRHLAQGGAVAIAEWVTDPDYCMASTVVTHLVLAGFGIEREAGGPANYIVIGRKAAPSAERHQG